MTTLSAEESKNMEENTDYLGQELAKETATFVIENHTLLKCNTDNYYVCIPDGVEQIAADAFSDCKNLKTIASRACLRYNVMRGFRRCMSRCLYGKNLLKEAINKWKYPRLSLWLWEVSEEDYTYALQQSIQNVDRASAVLNAIQWKCLTLNIRDILNHSIDENIVTQLPIIHPTSSFVYAYPKKEDDMTALLDETNSLGFGILRITGINQKELIYNPQFNYLHISEMHFLDGYGFISPQWGVVMDITSNIQLPFDVIPSRISPYVDAYYDGMSLDEYMDWMKTQGKVIQ